MVLTRLQIERILDILKKRHNLFVVKTIGTELLSEQELKELKDEYGEDALRQVEDFVKDGYWAGYLRNKDLGSVTEDSHEEFKVQPKPAMNDYMEYSVDHGKEVVEEYVQKLSAQAQANFRGIINEYNKRYKDYLMTNTALPIAIKMSEEGKTVSEMVTALRDATGDLARDWSRIASTETTNIINTGMTDKIIKINPDKSAKEIFVYKRVINDAALCPYCRKLHLKDDGVTPRVYRLSDVLANGSNIGKKQKDWQMVIGAVHPHCRCQLVQIPSGYYFNKEGKLEFIGEGEANKKVLANLE